MKIAIVGFGREGQSSLKYFSSNPGNDITVCDIDENIDIDRNINTQLGSNYLDNLDRFDLIVRSSGIKPSFILDKYPTLKSKITTQLNEFLRVCPSKNTIGITGTKGKGTTSSLVQNILKESGRQVVFGGNIGIPFLDLLDDTSKETFVVLELSSFQLTDLREAAPHIACCLMVVPEHLDWHIDLDDYISSKETLFKRQSKGDIAVYYGENHNSHSIAKNSPGTLIPYFKEPGALVKKDKIIVEDQEICKVSEVKLLGKHNLENICAAITVAWQITKDTEAIAKAVTGFSGLEHRIELVREVNGIKYFNDSFASGLAATRAAVEAVEGKKVLILGGYDRMLNLEEFAEFASESTNQFSRIMLIGESAKRLKDELDKVGFNNYILLSELKNMKDIVVKASELAVSGESVILSPGFASFDMFRDFEDRGNQYKEAVNNL